MDENQIQSSIKQVREKLQEQNHFPEGIKAAQIARRAQNFYDDINEVMRDLRIYHSKHADVIKLCHNLASYFLTCGDRCFEENKNDTLTNDKMGGLATMSLQGIEHTFQQKMDDDYQRNHWHGW